jgi:hypothetical protein
VEVDIGFSGCSHPPRLACVAFGSTTLYHMRMPFGGASIATLP